MPDDNIPSAFNEVAERHGRGKLLLVYNMGMAQQALARLQMMAEKHASRHGLHAVQVLAASLNEIATALVAVNSWTPEELALVERDIGLALAGKLVAIDGRRILDS